ncbi:hypothetical protein [Marixanthomonas ophiurae]|uniref:Uncharacterized protein n=1 Tax=Marixanthomonas ophiurae TaxID=387659 RepID=A0A3E1Q7W5_9FLAO|nr:hypothetical protein [Marixanthomonas ophiurae]RFN58212.1 hypothetical protein DZ858_13350 [Marixanthomonas ophiurae]
MTNICFFAAGSKVTSFKTITEHPKKAELINQAQCARQFYIASNYRTYRRDLQFSPKPKSLITPNGFSMKRSECSGIFYII